MAENTELLALIIDASGAVKGAKEVNEAIKLLAGGNKEIENTLRKAADSIRGQEKYLDSLTRRYDPAAAAAAKYAKEVSRLEGIIAGGGANSERAAQVLALVHENYKKLGDGADNASGKTSRFGAAMQQAGYQVADVANQVGAGGNAFVAVGMQLGQFLGAFGTVGAVAGAVISIMGPLAAKFLEAGDAAADADEKYKAYAKGVEELVKIEEAYNTALRERRGLSVESDGTESIDRRLREAEGRVRALADKKPGFFGGMYDSATQKMGFGRDRTPYEQAMAELEQARADKSAANDLLEAAAAQKLAKAREDLTRSRQNELDAARLGASGREREVAMLKAELDVRERMKNTSATSDVVDSEVASARSNAGAIYDLEQQKKSLEETERKAKESEKKFKEARDQYELETRAEEAKDLEKRTKGVETLNDYVYGLERETALLAVSATERERVNATLQAENIAKQAGIELGDEERARIDAAYEARERVTEAMKRQSQAEQQLEKFGERAFDRIGSAMTQMAMQGNSAFQSLRNIGLAVISELMQEFVKLAAINPLKNAIFGGSSPTLSGLLSGLFGDSSYGGTGAYGSVSDNITAGSGSFSSPTTVDIPMAFADGTNSAGSGLAVVGEEGIELVQMSGGERVYTADQTSRLLGGASNSNGQTVSITNYVEAGASMADVEAAVASGLQQAAPHFVNAAVQRSVPMAMAAMRNSVNRGGSDAQTFGRR